MVTVDGRVVTASATDNDDLFWGIRGGGANLGVVVSFEYRLHPVGPVVLGGLVIYPIRSGTQALRVFDDFSAGAPDEVSTAGFILTAPDGQPAVGIGACYSGSAAEGERVLEPLRTFATPLANLIAPQPYVQLQALFDDGWRPGRYYYNKSSIVRRLDEAAIDMLLAYGHALPTPSSVIAFQQLHGAASRVTPRDTAFPHRYHHTARTSIRRPMTPPNRGRRSVGPRMLAGAPTVRRARRLRQRARRCAGGRKNARSRGLRAELRQPARPEENVRSHQLPDGQPERQLRHGVSDPPTAYARLR
jgi:hypothetical protein